MIRRLLLGFALAALVLVGSAVLGVLLAPLVRGGAP